MICFYIKNRWNKKHRFSSYQKIKPYRNRIYIILDSLSWGQKTHFAQESCTWAWVNVAHFFLSGLTGAGVSFVLGVDAGPLPGRPAPTTRLVTSLPLGPLQPHAIHWEERRARVSRIIQVGFQNTWLLIEETGISKYHNSKGACHLHRKLIKRLRNCICRETNLYGISIK